MDDIFVTITEGSEDIFITLEDVYYLPSATSSLRGGIKVGSNLEIEGDILSAVVPTSLSELNDDSEHRLVTDTEKTYWNNKLDSYAETDPIYTADKPNIALKSEIPTATSELTNDSGFITGYAETDPIYTADKPNIALKSEIPTATSELTNDSGFITGYAETDPIYTADKPNIALKSEIPTATSELTNDSGFITGYAETDPVFTASPANNITSSHITILNNTSGVNTGDQDLSSYITTATLSSHTTNTLNPHSVTATQVGLGNVDNTSDANKPVSTATQTALNAKADDSKVVHLTGTESITGTKTFSGLFSKPTGYAITYDDNTIVRPENHLALQSPVSEGLWHDILAFCKIYPPVYETSVDGEIWTTATLNKKLFSHIETQTITVLDTSTNIACRWTWSSGIQWSVASWMLLAFTYSSSIPSPLTINVEVSKDGVSWTSLFSKSITSYTSNPHYLKLSQAIGVYSKLRLTLTAPALDTGVVNMSSIRLLTNRWGDQGKGKELEYPYTWDEEMNITFPNKVGIGTTAYEKFEVNGNVLAKQVSNGLQWLTSGASVYWNMDLGACAFLPLATNATLLNPGNIKAGTKYNLTVTQDATGGRTLDFGGAFKFSGGILPTLSATALASDYLEFYAPDASTLVLTNFIQDYK